MEVQNTRTSEARPKQKENKTRPEHRKHTKDPTLAPLFSAICDFFRNFLDCTKGSPLHLFRYFATQWMSKTPKGSSFYIFWHCDTVQKHFKIFFSEIF